MTRSRRALLEDHFPRLSPGNIIKVPGWYMHTTITDLFWDIDNIFVGAQQNAADRVLWPNKFGGSAHDRDRYESVGS